MNRDLVLILGLLAGAVAMFAANRPRMDAVALLMLALLPLTGVVSVNESLAGFSDPSVILIALLFVVGEGLVRTGVAQNLGDWLTARAGPNEARLVVLLMVCTGLLGSVMSSTGVVAIFIPVTLRIAAGTGIAPSRLMMPLSVAALISGMLTLVGTAPNLVINGELIREHGTGLGFFSFTPFGVVILAAGIGYMLFARRWLSQEGRDASESPHRPSLQDWIRQYGLEGR
ncbi:MAG: anion permease, partial [Verrucomicrobiales bacterium]|nr:anion permease [Verrucomicrobiales bacterium]